MDEPSLPPQVNENVMPNSTLAIVSLISALLGFTFVPVIGGIVALITGYMARKETRSDPPQASGDGLATAGIILGWIQVGLLVVGICCALVTSVFIFGWVITSSGR